MCAAALQQVQLDTAHLGAGLFLQHLCQNGGQTAQLGVTEAVVGGNLRLGHEVAVGIVDALGHSHDAAALLGVDALHIVDEVLHVEVDLRQIDQVGACAVQSGQRRSGGQPTGVTAHDLHDHDHAGIIHVSVLIDLHHGGGDILGGRSVAGAVISAKQIVVNGLGNAHHTAVIAHGLHVVVDLVAGIHGVVAAVIEEVADIMLFEYLQNALVIGVVQLGIGDLVAAGAESRGGGVLQKPQLLGILQPHVKQAVIQHALDAVLCAQHLGDGAGLQRRVDYAVGAGVNHRCRTARLADNAGTTQFIHINYLQNCGIRCLQAVFYHVKYRL